MVPASVHHLPHHGCSPHAPSDPPPAPVLRVIPHALYGIADQPHPAERARYAQAARELEARAA